MSDVTITYKGSPIATMDASGTKTLTTQGKYCEANIGVEYVKPSGDGGVDLSALEIYVADFLTTPPTVTEGALDGFHRVLVS